MDLTDKSNSSRNHRSTKQSVSESSNLHNVHESSSKSLHHKSKVSGNCHKSLKSDGLALKSPPNFTSSRRTVVKSRPFLRTLMPACGSTFTAHRMSTLLRSSALLVVMVVAAALCSGVEGKSVKSKMCSGMVCRAHEFCDRGTQYCESCRPICESGDESNQRICKRQCQEYLSLFTTSPPAPFSLSLVQTGGSMEGPGGLDRGSYTALMAGVIAFVVLLTGLVIVALFMLRKVAMRKSVKPVSLSSVQDSEDAGCKQSLAGSAAIDNEENNERQEEGDLSFSASGHKVAHPTDSSKTIPLIH